MVDEVRTSGDFRWNEFLRRDSRFVVPVVSFSVLLILLLFARDLPLCYRETIIPSLILYTIGTSIISSIHATAASRKNGRLDGWRYGLVLLAHAILFILLVMLFWKNMCLSV
ncbi:hypothetical protein D6833_04865 [Candidatus Parcubacteria bacterium]|nr:MAG: hypothetical protein D6833_04865 [Candidatus Parcubacteria bacterium]